MEKQDVLQVASKLRVKLTDSEIEQVLKDYPVEQELDPSGTWDLVIEQCIYNLKYIKVGKGLSVKVKNLPKEYGHNSGKVKQITKNLPNFGSKRSFELDNETGIWCIEDFEFVVGYEDYKMF